MKHGVEGVQHEENPAEVPWVPKSAEIFYINDFAAYSALPGGHLKREEFERVTKAAREPDVEVNETFAINANSYARHAGITLSPESLVLYSVLRSDPGISSELLRSDQPLLAEVLRIEGKADDMQKFVTAYPSIK